MMSFIPKLVAELITYGTWPLGFYMATSIDWLLAKPPLEHVSPFPSYVMSGNDLTYFCSIFANIS